MKQLDEVFLDFERLLERGNLKSAERWLIKTLDISDDVVIRIISSYNLGALYWTHIGDGEKARQYYQLTVRPYEENQLRSSHPKAFTDITANAYENLMFLSLSYDEFDTYTEKLRTIQPSDDVLRGFVPYIQKQRESGYPWSECFEVMTQMYYDRSNPQLNAARYGNAASSFHLLITHRRELRVSKEAFYRMIREYLILKMKLFQSVLSTQAKFDPVVPSEFLFILKDAKELVEPQIDPNYPAKDVRNNLDEINKCIHDFENLTIVRNQPACYKCGLPMTLISGKIVRTADLSRMNGCFQCQACGRLTCYDCSDNRIPCVCGAMAWVEKSYVPGDIEAY